MSPLRTALLPTYRLGCAVLALVVCLTGCEYRSRTDDAPSLDSLQQSGPDQLTWGAQFSVSEKGKRRAVIRADTMEQYRTSDSSYSVWQTLSDTGRVRSYVFEDGDSSATIIADSVRYYNADGQYEAFGNVIVQTKSGRRLESEHLTWDQFARKIRTRRFVEITTPTEIVRGNGLVADEDLETYQIGEFTAQVDIEDDTTR